MHDALRRALAELQPQAQCDCCSCSSWCPPAGKRVTGGKSSLVSVVADGTPPHASVTANGNDASVIPSKPRQVLLHPIAAGALPAFSKRTAHVLADGAGAGADDGAAATLPPLPLAAGASAADADVVFPQTLVQLLTFLPAHATRLLPTSLLPCTPPSWLIAIAAWFEYVASVCALMVERLPEISNGALSTDHSANCARLCSSDIRSLPPKSTDRSKSGSFQ